MFTSQFAYVTDPNRSDHLLKNHLVFQCNRCGQPFKREKDLEGHQRSDVPCQLANLAQEEGINQQIKEQLQHMKYHRDVKDEEQKWRRIYQVLFPNDDDLGMPSPCIVHRICGSLIPY